MSKYDNLNVIRHWNESCWRDLSLSLTPIRMRSFPTRDTYHPCFTRDTYQPCVFPNFATGVVKRSKECFHSFQTIPSRTPQLSQHEFKQNSFISLPAKYKVSWAKLLARCIVRTSSGTGTKAADEIYRSNAILPWKNAVGERSIG